MTPCQRFSQDQQAVLAGLVWQAIDAGLRGSAQPVPGGDGWLQGLAATFVTLHKDSDLRGCIGNLAASDGLGLSVVRNAHSAAFGDPRFGPVQSAELPRLTAEISVLRPMLPLAVSSRIALLAALRPGRDGLVVRGAGRSATFLPAVWDELPEPAAFVDHLWRKAGMAVGSWPVNIVLWTYQADKVAAPRPQ